MYARHGLLALSSSRCISRGSAGASSARGSTQGELPAACRDPITTCLEKEETSSSKTSLLSSVPGGLVRDKMLLRASDEIGSGILPPRRLVFPHGSDTD